MFKKIKKIKSSFWERNLSLAKISYHVMLATALERIFANGAGQKGIEKIVTEFSELKGSLMKAGQLISVYGQSFIPAEGIKILEFLQDQSTFVDVSEIEKIVARNFPNFLEEFEIDQDPLASASIGQVHRAIRIRDNKEFALKVQYPGIERSIDIDLLVLKVIMSLFKILPKRLDLKKIFMALKRMLLQELDYDLERQRQKIFYTGLGSKFIVPKVLNKFTNKNMLVSEYTPGARVQDCFRLDQKIRDCLGEDLIELILTELFILKLIQSDPNPANFKIDLKQEKWILYDFGACEEVSLDAKELYQKILKGMILTDEKLILEAFIGLGIYQKNDDEEYKKLLIEYCKVVGSVFQVEVFDWDENSIEEKLFEIGKKLLLRYPRSEPPVKTVFIDRKLSGTFFLLKKLKARTRAKAIVSKFLNI